MACGIEVGCSYCGYEISASGFGVDIATAVDTGALVPCPHPGESWMLARVTGGSGEFVGPHSGPVRVMSDWHCLSCGQSGWYRWRLIGAEALLDSEWGSARGTGVPGWAPERLRRCGKYQCAACGRRRLVSGALLSHLLFVPAMLWDVSRGRPSPLPCLRCRHRGGVRFSSWIS